MNLNYLIVSIFWIAFIPFNFPKNIEKKVNKEIISTYNIENYKLIPVSFSSNITEALPAEFEKNNFFKIQNGDKIIGHAYISKASSKTDDFDYLVLFDKDYVIVKSKVLIYREDYGSEIGSKRWLNQLIGKTQDDKLIYGDNIAAISGATISVKSMTNAVNDLLKSIKILHQKHLL